jgi:HAE1 family hydrophobic/amphiphilic exporter-1
MKVTALLTWIFIPVFFMGGILGRLLHEFAVVIGVAILISGFVSLSLTPMLCSRFLRPVSTERHGNLYALSERFFTGMFKAYEGSLKRVLKHRLATLIFSEFLVGTIYLFKVISKLS